MSYSKHTQEVEVSTKMNSAEAIYLFRETDSEHTDLFVKVELDYVFDPEVPAIRPSFNHPGEPGCVAIVDVMNIRATLFIELADSLLKIGTLDHPEPFITHNSGILEDFTNAILVAEQGYHY